MKKKGGVDSATFQRVCMNDIQTAEILGITLVLDDVDIVDGSFVGELVRWSLQKHPRTVRLLRYNNHIYFVAIIRLLFNAFRCPTCESYSCQPINLEQHSATCLGRAKNVSSKRGDWLNGTCRNVHQVHLMW